MTIRGPRFGGGEGLRFYEDITFDAVHLEQLKERKRIAAGASLERGLSGSAVSAMVSSVIRGELPVGSGGRAVIRTWDRDESRWFGGLGDDAVAAGNPMPDDAVIEESKRVVRGLLHYLLVAPDVYTTEDGEVAVEVFGERGRAFLLVCEPGGSALCAVTVNGVSRRARYENSVGLPDGFLKEGLREVLGLPGGWFLRFYRHDVRQS